ncbi:MAG TPA: hypothetical protein VIC25_03150 [Caulobacteraceae bacterium]
MAYLFILLLDHMPGAWAQSVSGGLLQGYYYTELGMRITAVAIACFVVGAFLVTGRRRADPAPAPAERSSFALFCLVGGWVFTFALSFLNSVSSFGAAAHEAGAIWMLGVMIGLREALKRKVPTVVAFWVGALAVYPTVMLVHGGYLVHGSVVAIPVISSLAITTRRFWRLALSAVVLLVVGLSAFVTYFEGRPEIRGSVWGGGSLHERVSTIADVAGRAHIIDPGRLDDLSALNTRLNQSYFIGIAADRLDGGVSEYLHGRSLWEGVESVVPRAMWSNKQVVAGSGTLVADATGLDLDTGTSWAVGNVMELYINFGWAGIVVGFVVLGFIIASLDRRAALAERRGDFGGALLFFLPCVAFTRPDLSAVDIASGAAAALIAALVWRMAWLYWVGRRRAVRPAPVRAVETS